MNNINELYKIMITMKGEEMHQLVKRLDNQLLTIINSFCANELMNRICEIEKNTYMPAANH